jgi:molybdopterin-containing oxidoreductase family iron-sulfur binding subunit
MEGSHLRLLRAPHLSDVAPHGAEGSHPEVLAKSEAAPLQEGRETRANDAVIAPSAGEPATAEPPALQDLDFIRSQLRGPKADAFWRSLDEVAGQESFRSWLEREFPAGASEWSDPVSRRHFVRIMGAAFAMAGLSACTRQPQEKILPYLEQPEHLVAGVPLFFATAMTLNGYATGLLVESNEGRPTKIEGNPQHPSSLGSTNAFQQAAILQLYDPDRSRTVTQRGTIQPWDAFLAATVRELARQRAKEGEGLRLLCQPLSSPTLAWQVEAFRRLYPRAKVCEWDPLSRFSIVEGCRQAFGQMLIPIYRFADADVVVSLDCDFLREEPDHLRLTREFTRRRRFDQAVTGARNQLFSAEPSPTETGSMADLRLPVAATQILTVALGLVNRFDGSDVEVPDDAIGRWVKLVAGKLDQHRGRSLVLTGRRQPPEVHALVHQLNLLLGNTGKTVAYRAAAPFETIDHLQRLRELTADLDSGAADSVIILGGNPVFDAPPDLDFPARLAKAKFSAHLSQYVDETSRACEWHIPEAHFLETWSDARAFDGTISLVQPLIEPLFGGRSKHQLLAALLNDRAVADYDLLRRHWQERRGWADFEKEWRRSLHDGVIAGTSTATVEIDVMRASARPGGPSPPGIRAEARGTPAEVEINFYPDPSLWDGQFANNAWLQELPRPFTKIVWDNPALVSADLAKEHNLTNGDIVELTKGSDHLQIPVWIQPGQAPRSVSLHLGYGRTAAGSVGNEVGFDTFKLRRSDRVWFADGISIRKSGRSYRLANTQSHHSMEGREIVRVRSLAELKEDHGHPEGHREHSEPKETLFNPAEYNIAAQQWGMVINLNACTGCNACVVACQAENNIPVVGKDQVWRGREMHWIRVDHYFQGDLDNPAIYHQPVPCMHCETAPCEMVCPVEATVHSADGLNQQIYNRCIGTRYCSNNCPYKVRRFNFLQYSDMKTPVKQLMHNPQVTMRTRGIMEKCTYCVQRISVARIGAHKENRPIRDGEITPACAQACPAEAIVFGDVADPSTRVSQWKASPLNYSLLGELNTRPRTTYLAKVKDEM